MRGVRKISQQEQQLQRQRTVKLQTDRLVQFVANRLFHLMSALAVTLLFCPSVICSLKDELMD